MTEWCCNNGKIYVKNDEKLTAVNPVGGIVGHLNNGKVVYSIYNGGFDGDKLNQLGGIVGGVQGDYGIEECLVLKDISCSKILDVIYGFDFESREFDGTKVKENFVLSGAKKNGEMITDGNGWKVVENDNESLKIFEEFFIRGDEGKVDLK